MAKPELQLNTEIIKRSENEQRINRQTEDENVFIPNANEAKEVMGMGSSGPPNPGQKI